MVDDGRKIENVNWGWTYKTRYFTDLCREDDEILMLVYSNRNNFFTGRAAREVDWRTFLQPQPERHDFPIWSPDFEPRLLNRCSRLLIFDD
jgi:hypothetical protein